MLNEPFIYFHLSVVSIH